MKRVLGIVISLLLLLTGCKDDVQSAGSAALQENEKVVVCATTFQGIQSKLDTMANLHITQTPDSFLLGEFNTESWGTIKADVLMQFACPEGYRFPDSTQIDSVVLLVPYSTWFGDGQSPLRVSVYEMDKATFLYAHTYTSDLDPSDYCSMADSTHIVVDDRTIIASQGKSIQFRMKDSWVEKWNTLRAFPNQTQFNEWFKGLYITTTFGASTAVYITGPTLALYYHYFYKDEQGIWQRSKEQAKYLYANTEVRQVNHYSFQGVHGGGKQAVIEALSQDTTTNYIVSPAYVYTVISIPMKDYITRIEEDSIHHNESNKSAYMNKAELIVEVLNAQKENTTYAKPAKTMMLIRKDSADNFFLRNGLPDDSYALYSNLITVVDSGNVYKNYYLFNLSTIFQSELSRYNRNHEYIGQDTIPMVLIPVNLEFSSVQSTQIVTKVKIEQTITSTEIRSAKHVDNPMDIDAIFSGFYTGPIK